MLQLEQIFKLVSNVFVGQLLLFFLPIVCKGMMKIKSVHRSKNEPTTTLPMKKSFEMSAAFEFCVLSSNFGFIG